MDKMTTNDRIQFVGLLVAIVAFVVTTIYTQRSIKASIDTAHKQSQWQMFSEYTRRYNEIFLNMPNDILEGTAELDGRTKKHLRIYFDLCSEEFHLHKKEVFPPEVWDIWVEGMQTFMESPLYREAWDDLSHEYNDEFKGFFNEKVLGRNAN